MNFSLKLKLHVWLKGNPICMNKEGSGVQWCKAMTVAHLQRSIEPPAYTEPEVGVAKTKCYVHQSSGHQPACSS